MLPVGHVTIGQPSLRVKLVGTHDCHALAQLQKSNLSECYQYIWFTRQLRWINLSEFHFCQRPLPIRNGNSTNSISHVLFKPVFPERHSMLESGLYRFEFTSVSSGSEKFRRFSLISIAFDVLFFLRVSASCNWNLFNWLQQFRSMISKPIETGEIIRKNERFICEEWTRSVFYFE